MAVEWTPFEVDGVQLEWSATRSVMKTEKRVLMVHVRHAGQEGSGVGAVHPVDAEPTEELARAAAKTWLESKKK